MQKKSQAPTNPPTSPSPPVTQPAPTYKRPQLKSLGTPSEPTGPSTAIQLEVISSKQSFQMFHKRYSFPGRRSNRAAARRTAHPLEVGQVQNSLSLLSRFEFELKLWLRWARRLGAASSFPLSPGGEVGVPSPGLYLVFAQVPLNNLHLSTT